MGMGRRFWIVVVASLAWGVLVAGVFHSVRAGGDGGKRAAAAKPLVTAVRMLPLGAVVSRDAVQVRMAPEDSYPPGGVARIEDVVDRPVISPIQAEEPVVEARLAARGSGPGLAPLIPNGMRAISVRVNDVVGVAGFVLPGMRVDVLATGRPAGGADPFTRTILQNVTVLSAGQTIETDGKNASMNVPVVTLLVNPAQAETLTLVNTEARIQLVLRNSIDEQKVESGGSQTRDVFGTGGEAPVSAPPRVLEKPRPAPQPQRPQPQPPTPAAVAAPPAVAAPALGSVVVIRGNAKTVETVAAAPREGK